uniref:Variant surface glycoprotein 685 n=1 Tax=Trypanosoma brucei TaxID=5691 RepID=M4T0P0_9TRYP|nr:variant surface glycoprotein 685 [Trypanosoma brucei]
MFIIRGALITAVLATIVPKVQGATPGLDAITNPCQEARFLDNLAGELESNLATAVVKATQLNADFRTLTLVATCQATAPYAPKAALLAAATAAAAANLESEIKAKQKTVTGVAAILARRAAQLRLANEHRTTAMKAEGNAVPAYGGTALYLTASNEHTCTQAYVMQQSPPAACDSTSSTPAYLATGSQEVETEGSIRLAADNYLMLQKIKTVVHGVGTLGGSALNGDYTTHCADASQNKGSVTKGLGLSIRWDDTNDTAYTTEKLAALTGGGANCKGLDGTETPDKTDKTTAAKAICSYLKAKIQIPNRPLDNTEPSLANQASYRQLVQLISDGSIDSATLETNAKTAASKLLASSTETPQQTIIEKLADTQITYKKDKEDNKVAVNNAETGASYGKIYALCFGQQQKALTEARNRPVSKNGPAQDETQNKPEEPKKTAEECKKHKTAGDCEKEKGCEFDDKKDPKCFPKAETDKKDEKSLFINLIILSVMYFLLYLWHFKRILAQIVVFMNLREFSELYKIAII